MNISPQKLVDDFVHIASIAGLDVSQHSISIETLSAPHTPPKNLPENKMAVYVFFLGNQCLKVGKAGPKTAARYVSQHYNPGSCRSNLAKSLLKNKTLLGLDDLNETNIKHWIQSNTSRINFLIDKNIGANVLNLLEVFLQCRLNPRFEGFSIREF